MSNRSRPITQTEARRSLHALDVLSHKVTEPPKPRQRKQQHEAKIQADLFKWAELFKWKYPELKMMFHVANGGRRDLVEGYHLKQQGVKSGVPDICLPVPRGKFAGLFLELKAKGGRLQDNQKIWLDDLARQGYKAVVCFGFDEAKAAIENYLQGESP